VRLAACAIAGLCSLMALPSMASAADPKPRTGKTVVVKRSSGTVLVSKRGSSRATRLGRRAVSIPVGSTVNATNGTVKLTSTANRSGSRRQSAAFYDGAFTVKQDKSARPLTELSMEGGDFSGCAGVNKRRKDVFATRNGGGDVFAAGSRSRRRLWGRGKGRFRTRGRNGTATVRGTTWLTEDLCEGTQATARSGRIDANANGVDLERQLEPGQSVIYLCNLDGFTSPSSGRVLSTLYCLVVLSQPADNIFGFGIATTGTEANVYQLCLLTPDQQRTSCDNYPFGPDDGGIKAGGAGCLPGEVGTYYAGWGIEGELLPLPMPFESGAPSTQPFCVSSPERPDDPHPSLKPGTLRKARAAARLG
jgi:hypothetical protein